MSERQRKENLKDKIEKLSECEHEQIFKIIKQHTNQYTTSKSGILVSADNLSTACIEKIESYIDFCIAQQERLDEDEAKRTALFKSMHTTE